MNKLREMIASLGFDGFMGILGIAAGLSLLNSVVDEKTTLLDGLDERLAWRRKQLRELEAKVAAAAAQAEVVEVVDVEVVDELVEEPAARG